MEDDERPGERRLPHSRPGDPRFTPEILENSVITYPLLWMLQDDAQPGPFEVIIDLNLDYAGGRERAREVVQARIEEAIARKGSDAMSSHVENGDSPNEHPFSIGHQYLVARLEKEVLRELVRLDAGNPAEEAFVRQDRIDDLRAPGRAIYRIWYDHKVSPLTTESIRIVKADAARAAFSALGEGIVWAVIDSGIDGTHPHFKRHENLEAPEPLCHQDFTQAEAPMCEVLPSDPFGHGTHVAGIIAGEMGSLDRDDDDEEPEDVIIALERHRDENGGVVPHIWNPEHISGVAPACKLLSLKVLDANGDGRVSNLIRAIDYVQEMNGHGRRIRIHGVNMSVGYDFDPEWFACGQSPLCLEVDRLVRSGVVVVAAAGNTGYGWHQTTARGPVASGMDVTINDPGNAELAITVGSTHRRKPHVYGVSYFSSKGPTGDGRLKPDLVAPGEKIISCAAGKKQAEVAKESGAQGSHQGGLYVEDSGTSMAAPHVSGAIASFLSIRPEFVGQSERVKKIFLSTATDLQREKTFQGHGLVDLMRAIQSV